MNSGTALAEVLSRTADELAALDAQMTPPPWKGYRTGGSDGIPESAMVSTGKDRWVAFPNEEPASKETGEEGHEFHAFPKQVYERVHPDCLGMAELRNRAESLASLLRTAAAEIRRLSAAAK